MAATGQGGGSSIAVAVLRPRPARRRRQQVEPGRGWQITAQASCQGGKAGAGDVPQQGPSRVARADGPIRWCPVAGRRREPRVLRRQRRPRRRRRDAGGGLGGPLLAVVLMGAAGSGSNRWQSDLRDAGQGIPGSDPEMQCARGEDGKATLSEPLLP